MFEFSESEILWWLLIIPLMIIIFALVRYKRKSVLRRLGQTDLLSSLMPDASNNRPWIKFILVLLSLLFIILAMAGPRFGTRLEEVRREGVEVIIALDVSRSMLAEDIRPNRLERSKLFVSRLIGNLRNDRVGLIVFAGDAFVQVPVTSDHTAARMILDNVTTDIVPVQGTAIGRAIDLAKRSFTDGTTAGKVIIVISDGEDHEDDPVVYARLAGEEGIIIHTVGMGRPEGAPIPISAGGETRFLTDEEGNTVISRLDESTLRSIAAAGGGLFIRSGTSGQGLDVILEEIDNLDKAEFDEVVYTEYEKRFQYMAFIALILLLSEFVIMERKNRWLRRIDLFR